MHAHPATRLTSAAIAMLMLSACAGGNDRPVADTPVPRVIVRANDRGPFALGRIIDLSRAAEALGMTAQGHAPGRVRRVEPSEKDRKRLRDGKPAARLTPVSGPELQRFRGQMSAKRR